MLRSRWVENTENRSVSTISESPNHGQILPTTLPNTLNTLLLLNGTSEISNIEGGERREERERKTGRREL